MSAIHVGDCRRVMAALPEQSVDAIVCDPPYEIGFMNKSWDSTGVAFDRETWLAALRLAKPGAYLLAFGSTRTYHRLVCAIEDAGWEIRDTLMWIYGSGFPKSKNGPWGGTALKPAHEPIVLARRQIPDTVSANWERHGTGGLNIDACRVETTDSLGGGDQSSSTKSVSQGWDRPWMRDEAAKAAHAARVNDNVAHAEALGRWPANVIHDGGEEVLRQFPQASGQKAELSGRDGVKTASTYNPMQRERSGEPSAGSVNNGRVGFNMRPGARRIDAGSAARFFYCAKASRAERNFGVEGSTAPAVGGGATMRDREIADWAARNGNPHPTVKPVELMRYLCRLITPVGGLVLDPFAGSGTTGIAARAEGYDFVGIEESQAYASIAEARIRAAQPGLPLEVTP